MTRRFAINPFLWLWFAKRPDESGTVSMDPWMTRSALMLSTVGLWLSSCAYARDEELQHGRELLQRMCARCHSVGRTGASPMAQAPPFRSFSETKLYDSDFVERLEEGYSSIHPAMPTFRFKRDDAEAVLNYMKSIQELPKSYPKR
ncbi:cytochrome c [Bradyrhizobium sp. WYCCWR 12699]|uniref:c-type cytochrome n=1 Tax=Bradyrhizobium sp. WYCCWR 12699 TaxID=3064203 RepID=UPI0028A41CBA|nr:cytochrome c [Bradyrhizobium sp. WYCCWR 12699]MDT4740672.1 cytochrome c [Bradyrhizobium sp. WYCCWR 12699]